MKKITKYLSVLFFLLVAPYCRSQEISINISGAPAISIGQSSYMLVSICNEDPNPVTLPAYKFASRITITPGIVITGVTNTDGSVLTGWETTHNLSADSSEVELLNATSLANAECISFHIKIKAAQTIDSAIIKAELVFPEKLVAPNRPENDASVSKVAIHSMETARRSTGSTGSAETSDQKMEAILFPNPLTIDKKLNITVQDPDKISSVKILDSTGKQVQQTETLNQINTATLEPGIYVIDITYKDGSATTHRVVKQ